MADTILDALNKLVEKNGGNTQDNKLIVDALNDLVESGGGSNLPTMTTTEFKQYLIDEGWQFGKTDITINGNTYKDVGTNSSFNIPAYPLDHWASAKNFLVVGDEVTSIAFSGNFRVSGNKVNYTSAFSLAKTKSINFVSCQKTQFVICAVWSTGITSLKSMVISETGAFDLAVKIQVGAVAEGIKFTQYSTDYEPQIAFGDVVLTKAKLEQLLTLIQTNQGV